MAGTEAQMVASAGSMACGWIAGEYKLLRGVKVGVEEVGRFQREIQAILGNPAEQGKYWAHQLREMTGWDHDIQDTVDLYEALEAAATAAAAGGSSSCSSCFIRVKGFLPWCMASHSIAADIDRIRQNIEQARERRRLLYLPTYNQAALQGGATDVPPAASRSSLPMPMAFDIDGPRRELISELMLPTAMEAENRQIPPICRLVSIVGDRKAGKTTVAKVVYQDLKGRFDRAAFVDVAPSCNPKIILASILGQVGDHDSHDSDDDTADNIKQKITNALEGKRYFIVIDADESIGHFLIDTNNGVIPFEENNRGSKIITTSLIKNNHDVRLSCKDYRLKSLPTQDFTAIYDDMSCQIRTCFLYVSIYPKDHIIERDELIRRWIAEGFIQSYEVGEGYFKELTERHMILPLYTDTHGIEQTCRVVHNVVSYIGDSAIDEQFVRIIDPRPNPPNKILHPPKKILSLTKNLEASEVRSLSCPASELKSLSVFLPDISLDPPLSSFRVLRVLYLQDCSSSSIKCIGNLVLLRYLRLSSTSCVELPKEIGNLRYLQTLDLKRAIVHKLPSTVDQLRQLRVLEISLSESAERSNTICKLKTLTKLQTLYIFALDVSLDFMLGPDWVPVDIRIFMAGGVHRQTEDILSSIEPSSSPVWAESSLFSRLPSWISQSTANKLSSLCITVKILRQEDLDTLGSLHALKYLDLQVIDPREMSTDGIRASNGKFWDLVSFKFASREVGLRFEGGAMRKLHRLSLSFPLAPTRHVPSDLDMGLENLTSLAVVDIAIDCRHAVPWQVSAVEAAMRSAATNRRPEPTLRLRKHFVDEMKDVEHDGDRHTRMGLWGGKGGTLRDIEPTVTPDRLQRVIVRSGDVVDYLEFTFLDRENKAQTYKWGGLRGKEHEPIELREGEFLKEISGTVGPFKKDDKSHVITVITSLTFIIDGRRDEVVYGRGGGDRFKIPGQNNGRIDAFFVRAGWYIDAIGVYFRPIGCTN